MRRLRATLVLLSALAASCAHLGARAGVSLDVQSNVPESTIWVDDVLVGTVNAWSREGRHVRPGFHRVEVRAAGYYSVYTEIDQPDGGHATVKANLRPLLD
jgi:hypothetical protein